MLAPIPQFPALNPIDNPEDAKERQGLTLQAMVEAGDITQAEAEAAFAEAAGAAQVGGGALRRAHGAPLCPLCAGAAQERVQHRR
jgi:membrane carboxypeptidase/penicillin-binding protein